VALAHGRWVSGGYDGKIKFWREDGTGEQVAFSNGSPVWSLAALPHGRLASGGQDGSIKLWPKEAKEGMGEPVILSRRGPGVSSLAVLADGRLASADTDGKIKLWLVDEQKLIEALCLRAGRNLANDEWAHYIADTSWRPSCRDFRSNWRTPPP
jgi:WD40 repeat protein